MKIRTDADNYLEEKLKIENVKSLPGSLNHNDVFENEKITQDKFLLNSKQNFGLNEEENSDRENMEDMIHTISGMVRYIFCFGFFGFFL